MVEATGESIYHTVLATKCSILPRHLLSIIMASFAQHWVLVPTIHANQISREKKRIGKREDPGDKSHCPSAPGHTQLWKSVPGRYRGQGKVSDGWGKKGAKKRKEKGEGPVLYVSSHHFFFRLSETFPCPHYLPLCLRRWPQVRPVFTLW